MSVCVCVCARVFFNMLILFFGSLVHKTKEEERRIGLTFGFRTYRDFNESVCLQCANAVAVIHTSVCKNAPSSPQTSLEPRNREFVTKLLNNTYRWKGH